MSIFSCQCQNYRGNLVVTEREFYFTCSLFRIDLEWGNVKRIRLETQQVKGAPTSVLVVVLQHTEAIQLQATGSTGQKRGAASRKYYFYGFLDLLGAEEQVKHHMAQFNSNGKLKKEEPNEEMDKTSSVTTRREKATERDEVSSSGSLLAKDESMNLSRTINPRRPESEPSRPLALSFGGRRMTASAAPRPRVPARIMPSAAASAAAATSRHLTKAFLLAYRYLTVILVLLMIFLISRRLSRVVTADRGPTTATAERLLRDVDALATAAAELEAFDSHESFWRYNRARKKLGEVRHSLSHQLEQASVELIERYVATHARLTSLRGQRAARLTRERHTVDAPPRPPPLPQVISEKEPVHASPRERLHRRLKGRWSSGVCAGDNETCSASSAPKATPQKKKLSTASVFSDLQKWGQRGTSLVGGAARVVRALRTGQEAKLNKISASAAQEPSANGWVIYGETVDHDLRLTEWVASAEAQDRHQCLRLSNDLLHTVDLTERLLATFTSLFFGDRYRDLASGEERGSHWLQPPQALRTVAGGQKYFASLTASSDAAARMAMLRRFVASILHNDPLVNDQAQRRYLAMRAAEASVQYREEEVRKMQAAPHTASPESVAILWNSLNEMVLTPAEAHRKEANTAAGTASSVLRNSMEELRFWHTHDTAWKTHVLASFDHGADGEDGHFNASAYRATAHWRNLPYFRGLLCFHDAPVLTKVESVAQTSSPKPTAVAVVKSDVKDINQPTPSSIATTEEVDFVVANATPAIVAQSIPTPLLSAEADIPSVRPAAAVSTTPASQRVFTTVTEEGVQWRAVKLRWMADLNVFRLAFDAQPSGRALGTMRSYRMEAEDRGLLADAAEIRRHFFRLIGMVNDHYVRYMTPSAVQRFGSFLRGLFPPYSTAGSRSTRDDAATLRSWGMQDPAVQLATTQVTGFPLGTTRDVSSSLLCLVLQPPPLLQTSMVTSRQTLAASIVLILFGVVVAVLYLLQ